MEFRENLERSFRSPGWESDSEPEGQWGNRKSAARYNGFLGQSGVLKYDNYFDKYLVPVQTTPTNRSMTGTFGVNLTWNSGDENVPAPYGKFDGYHVHAEKYSMTGYDGLFDHDYARYVQKDIPVGHFVRTNSGGWGYGGSI